MGSTEAFLPGIATLGNVTVPVMRNSGIWVATLEVALAGRSKVFENSEEVRMCIAWRYSDLSELQTTYCILKRRQRREVAWST